LGGGTYVPMECMLATSRSGIAAAPPSPSVGAVTSRELAVVRAIQQGKSNKVMAYDLNMCESTNRIEPSAVGRQSLRIFHAEQSWTTQFF
jgi:DNA-binding NarL/FixJ family response regulator